MARQGLTDKEKSDILLEAWVGPRYRKMKFSSLGKAGSELLTIAKEGSDDFVYDGRSLFVYGPSANDAALIFGAALAFKTVNVKAIHLSALSDAFDTFDGEKITTIQAADVVILTGFYDKSSPESPLSERSKFRVEWFLNERYSMEKGIVIAGSSEPKLTASWWPRNVVSLLENEYEAMAFSQKIKEVIA